MRQLLRVAIGRGWRSRVGMTAIGKIVPAARVSIFCAKQLAEWAHRASRRSQRTASAINYFWQTHETHGLPTVFRPGFNELKCMICWWHCASRRPQQRCRLPASVGDDQNIKISLKWFHSFQTVRRTLGCVWVEFECICECKWAVKM